MIKLAKLDDSFIKEINVSFAEDSLAPDPNIGSRSRTRHEVRPPNIYNESPRLKQNHEF